METNERLIHRAKNGDTQAMEQLYKQNIGIIHKVINRYAPALQYEHDDLRQEAYFALVKAANDYDDTKGAKFITYFYKCLIGYILKLRNNDKNKDDLTTLNAPLAANEPTEGIDLIADPAAAAEIDNVLNNLEYLEIKILLRSTLKKALTPSQQQAIQLRYYDGYNVENTADIMGVALEKARQLEKTAIKELRKKTESTAPLHKFYQERRGAYE